MYVESRAGCGTGCYQSLEGFLPVAHVPRLDEAGFRNREPQTLGQFPPMRDSNTNLRQSDPDSEDL